MNDENSEKTPEKDADENGAPPAKDAEARDEAEGEAKGEASGWAKGDLEALREENAELKDRLLRTAAEMENLRRRTERDKSDTAKFAISNFARDVLTIADNIQRAIDHVPEEAAEKDEAFKSFREGVQVTERELLNVLERHGINRLDPAGERFDPNKHQAMFEVETEDVAEGTIVEVVQRGYVIAERVLRPALVGVSKGGPKQPKPEPAEATAEAPQAANDDTPESEPDNGDAPPAGKGDGKTKKNGKRGKKTGGKVDKGA